MRALRILRQVDVIACEDTRQTQKLLNHYGIGTPMISYHEHNEMTRAAELIRRLEDGARIALVTDAGMPAVSDPGFRLISLAIRHHIPVIPIPGRFGIPVGAGGQRAGHRFLPLQRLSAGQTRRTAHAAGNHPQLAAHADLL